MKITTLYRKQVSRHTVHVTLLCIHDTHMHSSIYAYTVIVSYHALARDYLDKYVRVMYVRIEKFSFLRSRGMWDEKVQQQGISSASALGLKIRN